MTPAALAFFGPFSLPSSSSGLAAMAPSLRTSRVVPPAPGKMPIWISGRPILADPLSAAKMRWQAKGSSSPIPSAVPGRAAAMGLPPLLRSSMPARSILRSMWCPAMVKSNSALAGSSPASSRIVASVFRSMPPAKSRLPLVMTMPLTVSSASAVSIRPLSTCIDSRVMTFMDRPGMSQVMVATPSASVVMVKSVMSLALLTRVR
jgi:hypothetical protein